MLKVVRLIYPVLVSVTTISSRSIKDSISWLISTSKISVLLGTENCSLIFTNSSFIIFINLVLDLKIDKYSTILTTISFNSSTIFSRSNPVSLCKRNSKIAFAWLIDSLYKPFSSDLSLGSPIKLIKSAISVACHSFSRSNVFASSESLEDLINTITSSILATARAKPTNIFALSLAFSKSNIVLLVITSSLNAKNKSKTCLVLSCSGLPPFKANMLTPK